LSSIPVKQPTAWRLADANDAREDLLAGMGRTLDALRRHDARQRGDRDWKSASTKLYIELRDALEQDGHPETNYLVHHSNVTRKIGDIRATVEWPAFQSLMAKYIEPLLPIAGPNSRVAGVTFSRNHWHRMVVYVPWILVAADTPGAALRPSSATYECLRLGLLTPATRAESISLELPSASATPDAAQPEQASTVGATEADLGTGSDHPKPSREDADVHSVSGVAGSDELRPARGASLRFGQDSVVKAALGALRTFAKYARHWWQLIRSDERAEVPPQRTQSHTPVSDSAAIVGQSIEGALTGFALTLTTLFVAGWIASLVIAVVLGEASSLLDRAIAAIDITNWSIR